MLLVRCGAGGDSTGDTGGDTRGDHSTGWGQSTATSPFPPALGRHPGSLGLAPAQPPGPHSRTRPRAEHRPTAGGRDRAGGATATRPYFLTLAS